MGNTSPLRKAIRSHDTATVQQILQDAGDGSGDLINEDQTFDCLLDCCASNYQHPLHTTLGYPEHKQDMIRLLVEHGADVNATGNVGQTCVHRAAVVDHLTLVKLFLDNGGNLYAQDNNGQYPIHYAARARVHGRLLALEVLKYFVEEVGSQEDLKLCDDVGDTPLHVAVSVDNVPAVRYIIQHGGDTPVRNKYGKTPLNRCKPSSECRKLLDNV